MMNRRHKFVLFFTLVITGCALLGGASISQALGLTILGGACAWIFGSETTMRGWSRLRAIPAAMKPWLRFPFILGVAGGIFGVILAFSNLNTFLSVGAMTLWGLLLSSEQLMVTSKGVARAAMVVAAFVSFFVTLLTVSFLLRIPVDRMERVGELAVAAVLAMLIGRFWLSKAVPTVRLSVLSGAVAPETTPHASKRGLFRIAVLYFFF